MRRHVARKTYYSRGRSGCRRRSACWSPRVDVIASRLLLPRRRSLLFPEGSNESSIIFMVYGSRRVTESVTTTGIAWLHNITTQGNLICHFIEINLHRNSLNILCLRHLDLKHRMVEKSSVNQFRDCVLYTTTFVHSINTWLLLLLFRNLARLTKLYNCKRKSENSRDIFLWLLKTFQGRCINFMMSDSVNHNNPRHEIQVSI